MSLLQLAKKIAASREMHIDQVQFRVEGDRVPHTATPIDLDLMDDDMIDVIFA